MQWELVLQYEDGSLPSSAWNEHTLAAVAAWYAANLSREQATTRYEQHYHKNRRRLTNRLDKSAVPTSALESVDGVWESLLMRALEGKR
jgi:hypothetical protein